METQTIDGLVAAAAEAADRLDYRTAGESLAAAAAAIRESGRDEQRLPEILGRHALLMRRARSYPEALTLVSEAIAAAADLNDVTAQARWLGLQGNLHRLTKSFPEAESAFTNARQLYESLGHAGLAGIADQEGNFGVLDRDRGNDRAAEYAYRRAVEIAARAGAHYTISTYATNLANALTRRRRYHGAWAMYERAMAASSQAQSADSANNVAVQWANSYRDAHRYAEAARILLDTANRGTAGRMRAPLLVEALGDLERAGDWAALRQWTAVTLETLEGTAVKDKVLARVRQYARDAEQALAHRASESPAANQPTALDVLVPVYMSRFEQARDAEGMRDFAHLVCDVRWALGEEIVEGWQAILTDSSLHYRVLGDAMVALCEAGNAEASLEISQRLKGLPYALPSLRALGADASISNEARAYVDALGSLRATLGGIRTTAGPDMFQRAQRVRAAGEALLEAGEYLRDHDRILQARLGGVVLPRHLIDAFPADSPVAAVDFVLTTKGMLGHVIARVGSEVQVRATFAPHLSPAVVHRLAAAWMKAAVRPQISTEHSNPELREVGEMLHTHFFCSLASQLAEWGIVQVIIVPDAFTRQLPLHLARMCGKEITVGGVNVRNAEYFCELFPVEYAPCLQAIAVSQHQKRPTRLQRVVAFSDPTEDLPGARLPRETVSVPPDVTFVNRAGREATLAALNDEAPKADVLVIGTHGLFDSRVPDESYLKLADGRWTRGDMATHMTFSRNPAIVLAACEVGAAQAGDDPAAAGIPGALLSAGAAFVVGALWPVEDVSMSAVIERFLVHLQRPGLRPAAALFRAAKDVRQLSRDEAIARCQQMLAAMRADGRAERVPKIYMELDWFAIQLEQAPERPFASPEFWGGVIVIGSGWHSPAGAVVGASRANVIESMAGREDAQSLLDEGKTREARTKLTGLLGKADGVERARTLDLLATAVLRDAIPECRQAAIDEALELLADAMFVARAEQAEQLVRNIEASRRKMLLWREG